KDMPGASTSMQLDTKTMNKALAKIPEIKDFSTTSNSKSTNKMSKKEMDSVEKLLKLPMINEIKDPKEKKNTLIQLMDIFKNMPSSTTASSGNQLKQGDLQTIQELLALPDISSIKDPNEKTAAVIKLVDIFSKMPNMNKDNAKSDEMMSAEQLKNVQQLLKLPMLNKITDPTEKTNVLNQMLDIFSKMPDMGTTTDKTNSKDKFDSKSIKSVQEFITLLLNDKENTKREVNP
ncbi:MAG: hypothetical protein VB130_05605, partial [Clostridium sp.]|nr:hypothetical protein [Clostridium sp.]